MSRATPLALLLLAGCLLPEGPGAAGSVDLPPRSPDALRLVYLGTGGWIMEYRGEKVLTGPFFSNPSLFATGLLPIRADTVEIDRHMARYDVADPLDRP